MTLSNLFVSPSVWLSHVLGTSKSEVPSRTARVRWDYLGRLLAWSVITVFVGCANIVPGSTTTSVQIAAAASDLGFAPIPAKSFGQAPFTISASSSSHAAVSYAIVSGPATLAGATVTITGAGTLVLAAQQAADGGYAAGSTTTSVQIAAAASDLGFAPIPAKSFGQAPFTISASSSSHAAVSYAIVSGPATLAGATVTITGAGTLVLAAQQAADGGYAAGSTTTSVQIAAAASDLGFAPIPAKSFGQAPFTISASSSSHAAVSYAIVSGPATLAGATVTITGAGTLVLAAQQAADGGYAAGSTTTSVQIAAAASDLGFAPIPAKSFGQAPFTISASSSSHAAVSYAIVSGPATLAGATVTITGAGTLVLAAQQAADGGYAAGSTTTSVQIAAAASDLGFAPIPAKSFGQAPFTISASSSSHAAVSYAIVSGPATLAGATVTITGAGTLVLAAQQAADGGYAAGSTTTSVQIAAAASDLGFAPIPAKSFGQAPFTISASSSSHAAVSYAIVSGPATLAGATVTITGAGTLVLAAQQAADGGYAAGSTTTSVQIAAAASDLGFAPIPAKSFGQAPFTISASSSSHAAVSYAIVSGPATLAGATVTITGAGTLVLAAQQAADGGYAAGSTTTSVQIAAAASDLGFAPIPAKSFGQAPFTISASSSSHAAVSYAIVSGPATLAGATVTITGAGTLVLAAQQAADGGYAAGSTTTSVQIAAAASDLGFAPIPAKSFGQAPFTISASSSSHAAVSYAIVSGPATLAGATVTITGAGTLVLAAQQAADGGYAAGSTTTSVQIAARMKITSIEPESIIAGQVSEIRISGDMSDVQGVQFQGSPIQFTSTSNNSLQFSAAPAAWATGSYDISILFRGGENVSISLPLSATSVSYDAAVRFLQQAAYGATQAQVTLVQQLGFEGWIDQQIATQPLDYILAPKSRAVLPKHTKWRYCFAAENGSSTKRDICHRARRSLLGWRVRAPLGSIAPERRFQQH